MHSTIRRYRTTLGRCAAVNNGGINAALTALWAWMSERRAVIVTFQLITIMTYDAQLEYKGAQPMSSVPDTPVNVSASSPSACQHTDLRNRLGISIGGTDALALLDSIVEAEIHGVRQIWMTGSGTHWVVRVS